MDQKKVVPMIHVPDVRATVDWYREIGFTVLETFGNEGDGLSFAMLSFGSGEVMFNQDGETSDSRRREVDLYTYTDNVDDLYERIKDRVDVVEGPHDTFYGMREFIIRDLNRFWITFGQASAFQMLLNAVTEGNAELVQTVLDSGSQEPESLTAALAIAAASDHNVRIVEMLKTAGGVPPFEVDIETLQSYVGKYRAEPGIEFHVTFKDGKLFAALGSQPPLSLMAVDKTTFKPIGFDNFGTITFNVEAGETVGCGITHGDGTMQLKREADS